MTTQQVQFFKARYGRRRSFLSQRDADAYDEGWHDTEVDWARRGPYMDGVMDHEAADDARRDFREEQADIGCEFDAEDA